MFFLIMKIQMAAKELPFEKKQFFFFFFFEKIFLKAIKSDIKKNNITKKI